MPPHERRAFAAVVDRLNSLGHATVPASFTDSNNPALRFDLPLPGLLDSPKLTAVIAPIDAEEGSISILVPNIGTDLGDAEDSERLRAWALNVNYSSIYVRVGIDSRDGEIRFISVLPAASLSEDRLSEVIGEIGEVAMEYLTIIALRHREPLPANAPIRFE